MSVQETIAKAGFGQKQRIRVYRQIERLLRNGRQLREALDIVYMRFSDDDKHPTKAVPYILNEWRIANRSGKSLGQAMIGWVPNQEQMLIEAGELSGTIGEAFNNVIRIAHSGGKMRTVIIGSIAYPIILGTFIIIMLYGFGNRIVPAFGNILDPNKWTGMAKQMYGLSSFTQNWTIPSLIAVGVLITLYLSTVAIWTGGFRTIFDKLPPWSMYRLSQGTSFMLSLSALIRAGIPIGEALIRIRKHSSPYLVERIDETLYHYNTGANLGECLHRAGHGFPDPDMIQDLRIYASLARFEEAVEMLAYEWLDESVERLNAAARAFNMIMLFLMAAIIGWLGWGLFEIQKQVTAAAGRG
jgi:type II secretory pathway component PulF